MSSLQGRILRSRRFVQGLLLTVSSRDRLKTSPIALHWFPSNVTANAADDLAAATQSSRLWLHHMFRLSSALMQAEPRS